MLSREKPPKKVTMWLQDDNRRSIVSVRLSGMNMQGTGTTGFIFKKETFVTKFTIECSICAYRWTVTRTFNEFAELYATMHNNPTISARRRLMCEMPEGEDGDTSDVMELVERKDMLEKLLKEAVSQLDCFIYQPLSNFIDLMGNIIDFDETVRFLQRNMRKYLVKMHLNMILFQYYSEEMTCLTYALEEGIEVYSYELVHMNATMECDKDVTVLDASITSSAVPANEASGIGTMKLIKRKCMLWIDVDPNEPGLSRVCLVNKTNLKAYKQQQSRGQMPYHCNRRSSSGDVAWYNRKSSLDGNSKRDEFGGNGVDQYAPEEAKLLNDEDERFSKGLYMSDIAEVRIGCNSFVFRYAAAISMVSSVDSNATAPNPLPFDSSQCFSIVGSERTMEIELVDTHYPPSITKNTNVMKRLGGNKKTLPVLSFRDYITDFMNLSVIHSLQLYEQEDVLRNKKWIRYRSIENSMAKIPSTSKSLQSNASVFAFSTKETQDAFKQNSVVNANIKSMAHKHHSNMRISKKSVSEGNKLRVVLENSIKVDEELFSIEAGTSLFPRYLVFNSSENCIYIHANEDFKKVCQCGQSPTPTAGNKIATRRKSRTNVINSSNNQPGPILPVGSRMLYLDDISEVRPGKLSYVVDGNQYPLCLTIVGSETIITLPVGTIPQRDKLLFRFQSFIETYKKRYYGNEAGLLPCYMSHMTCRSQVNGPATASGPQTDSQSGEIAAPTALVIPPLAHRSTFQDEHSVVNSVTGIAAPVKVQDTPTAGDAQVVGPTSEATKMESASETNTTTNIASTSGDSNTAPSFGEAVATYYPHLLVPLPAGDGDSIETEKAGENNSNTSSPLKSDNRASANISPAPVFQERRSISMVRNSDSGNNSNNSSFYDGNNGGNSNSFRRSNSSKSGSSTPTPGSYSSSFVLGLTDIPMVAVEDDDV